MSELTYNRHEKTRRITIWDQSTTTTIGSGATTSYIYGSAVNLAGLTNGTIQASVLANASGAPSLILQYSCDGGTTYTTLTTSIIADMTTTANSALQYINNFADTVRGMVVPASTTSSARFTIKGVFKTG